MFELYLVVLDLLALREGNASEGFGYKRASRFPDPAVVDVLNSCQIVSAVLMNHCCLVPVR